MNCTYTYACNLNLKSAKKRLHSIDSYFMFQCGMQQIGPPSNGEQDGVEEDDVETESDSQTMEVVTELFIGPPKRQRSAKKIP